MSALTAKMGCTFCWNGENHSRHRTASLWCLWADGQSGLGCVFLCFYSRCTDPNFGIIIFELILVKDGSGIQFSAEALFVIFGLAFDMIFFVVQRNDYDQTSTCTQNGIKIQTNNIRFCMKYPDLVNWNKPVRMAATSGVDRQTSKRGRTPSKAKTL